MAVHTPLKIVSLAPSVTSILYELGARDHLVGVTRWCRDVVPAKALEGLVLFDDCWNADPAKVAELAPGLVIGSVPYRGQVVEGIIARGIRFLATYPRCLADIYADIRLLARIVGREAEGERLVESMRSQIAAVGHQIPARRRPRVYCEEWSNPLQNSQGWVEEMVTAAGGEFVPKPAARKVTAEEVIAADPEIIVLAWCGTNDRARADLIPKRSGWGDISAVKSGSIHVVRDEFLNTPGPSLLEGLKALAAIIGRMESGDSRQESE
jgi:iron complex transport system substrate-binding protein